MGRPPGRRSHPGPALRIAALIDRRVAPWAHSLTWGRLEGIVDAARIEADPDAAQATANAALQAQGVWVGSSSEHGIKDIHIRTEAPDAIWFDAAIDRIADGLEILGDGSSKDVRRAKAVGVIAQPQRTLDLFADVAPAGSVASERSDRLTPVDTRPPATLYVHLAAIDTTSVELPTSGVARIEGVGPVTAQQVRDWLSSCEVTVKPVIDLAGQVPVDHYEIPDLLREPVHLRTPADIFPFASNTGRRKDLDHTQPYRDPGDGEPLRQTGMHNLGPMTRRHHRMKTHSRWQVRQPFPGIYIWRTPHDRYHLVDHTGTQRIRASAA